MHPKVKLFLSTRDDAYRRNDAGVVRSMNFELRRLGIRDEATLADPSGKHPRAAEAARTRQTAPPARSTKPKTAKCEHGSVAERCPECNEELAAR